MAGAVQIQLRGWKELDRRLKGLPAKIERGVFRKALRSTGKKIARAMKKGTPAGPPRMGQRHAKATIKVKVRVRRGGAYARIGYTGRQSMTIRMLERGGRGGAQPARPFFDRAIGRWRENAEDDFTKALRREVEKVV